MILNVAIFDDDQIRREGLRLLIDSTEGMQCTGIYENCKNAVEATKTSKPDVILMDINMPFVNGIEGVIEIKKVYSDIKILIQTIFEDDAKIFAAICAGADGYILKKTSPSKLIEGIMEVHKGGAPMTPTIATRVLRLFHSQNKIKAGAIFDLSDRELEILKLLVEGNSYKMIANKCFISYPTVNTHITHIYKKLQVNSVVEAVTIAINQKLV